jgi:Tfp pilus assembly protein PilX
VTSVATVPWKIGGANVGVTYAPPNMAFSTSGGLGTYYASPVFYISYLGVGTTPGNTPGLVYQIDAVGYGGGPNSVAVVESTYVVPTSSAKDLGSYQ